MGTRAERWDNVFLVSTKVQVEEEGRVSCRVLKMCPESCLCSFLVKVAI